MGTEDADGALKEQTDDAYRALGRYVVQFSRLIRWMRVAVGDRIAVKPEDQRLVEIALGEATASQIANAFFAICDEEAALDPDEIRVGRTLQRSVGDAITSRNDIAHGDWWLGWASQGATEIEPPSIQRVKPARKKGPFDRTELSASELDGQSDRLIQLRDFVAEYGALCIGEQYSRIRSPGTRVKDIFVFVDDELSRGGPLADGTSLHTA